MPGPYVTAPDERERLILEYLPKVRWIAAGIHERLGDRVPEEDLVSAGIVGLIQAIDNYDPGRNAALWTYAEHKIRGAILDAVRGLDGVAAHKRKQLRVLQSAIAAVEQRQGRTAEEEEIAAEMRVGVDEYRQMLVDVQGITLESLDAPPAGSDEENPAMLEQYVPDRTAADPFSALAEKERSEELAAAIAGLPDAEQTVLHLYFAEELTLAEIGTVMNLHFSRVSQIKSQALLRLKGRLQRRLRKGTGENPWR